MQSVIHAHWDYDSKLPRTAYITRDGRDVLVSMYFHQIRTVSENRHPRQARKISKRFERSFGRSFDASAVRANMPKFIEMEMTDPANGHVTWPGHVTDWRDGDRPQVAYVTYEGLLEDTVGAFGRLATELTGTEADPDGVKLAVERFEFARMSGRASGTEDRTSFQRKGIRRGLD